ncbi:MAG TPA: DUF5700 domain-containing putative Zn-dependent protease [Gemmatimonadales bacterium]|nr:DUF5700 domain-containing putative Zn-dependent protease [Gemmatimonadales bacterium]
MRFVRTCCCLLLLGLIGVAVPAQTPSRDTALPATGIDFSGVDEFWVVGGILERDAEPSERDWQTLFSTPGYRLAFKNLGSTLRDNIDLALRPSRHAEFLRAVARRDDRGLALEHIALAWTRRAELEAYRDSLAHGTPIADALALAARYLPPGATKNGPPPLVTFAIFKDDGYSFPQGVVVDLLYARVLAEGGTPLTRDLAHEFHHSFVNRMAGPASSAPGPDAELRDALYNLRNEGLADQIDKAYPFHSPDPGLAQYAAQYNMEYARTPEVIQDLDSMLSVMARDSGAARATAMQASMLFWSNGHPNGAYIAREILETFGVDSLYPAARSPAAFLRTFQWAERRHGRKDPFSKKAWGVLDGLEGRYWR